MKNRKAGSLDSNLAMRYIRIYLDMRDIRDIRDIRAGGSDRGNLLSSKGNASPIASQHIRALQHICEDIYKYLQDISISVKIFGKVVCIKGKGISSYCFTQNIFDSN